MQKVTLCMVKGNASQAIPICMVFKVVASAVKQGVGNRWEMT